ncbi:MAG: hypothetical protein Q8876_02820 [Bacillota bacterium]|nr:hypothetical protein [Bacillota bacterium]
MYNFFEKIRQFMFGRNGFDQLGIALLVLYFLLNFIRNFFWLSFGWVPFLVLLLLLILFFFRFFSKNVWKRQKENEMFMKFWRVIQKNIIEKISNAVRHAQDPVYKYFHCPRCRATLRLPRNRGKIDITCPKCNYTFRRKT